MGQLVIVVLSIVLASIVVCGGVSYLRSDMGVRAEVALRTTNSYRTLETAIGAYRVANNGAMPRSGAPDDQAAQATWRNEIAPYLPAADTTPRGMSWKLSKRQGSRVLCIESDAPLSEAGRSGLAIAARDLSGVLVASCLDATAIDQQAASALLVDLKTGG